MSSSLVSFEVLGKLQPNHPVHLVRMKSNRGRGSDEIATALRVFWARHFPGMAQDLFAFGPGVDRFLSPRLRSSPELHKTTLAVRTLAMIPIWPRVSGYTEGAHSLGFSYPGCRCGGNWEVSRDQMEKSYPYVAGHVESLYSEARVFVRSRGYRLLEARFEFGYTREGDLIWAGEKFGFNSARYVKDGSSAEQVPSREFFQNLTGMSLEDFQCEVMGIKFP